MDDDIALHDNGIQERLERIKNRICDRDTFQSIYGIDLWRSDSEVAGMFRVWAGINAKGKQVLFQDGVDRWSFEFFLQQSHMLPLKNASIKFAMFESDFLEVISRLCDNSLIPSSLRFGQIPGLYPSSLIDGLPRLFPAMRTRFFTSNSDFIRSFHAQIADDLGFNVNTVYSDLSRQLNESPLEAAYEYDVLTREAMGVSRQVWLDFKKPLALKPDACSLLTYVKHKDILAKYCPAPPTEAEEARITQLTHGGLAIK